MKPKKRWIVLIVIVAGAFLLLSERSEEDLSEKAEASKTESVLGEEFKPVTLTEKEAQRLGIETTEVWEEQVVPSGGTRKVVPYAAIIYGLHGETWLYTNSEPLTLVRQKITVERIAGDMAILSEGPPPGTKVVTVGVAELYGVETGVGK